MRARIGIGDGSGCLRTAVIACLLLAGTTCLAATGVETPSADAEVGVAENLPDAPEARLAEPATAKWSGAPVETTDVPDKKIATEKLDAECQSGEQRGKACRVQWLPILWEGFEATAYEHLGNIAFDSETRHDLVTNPYWSTYVYCVKHFRYDQWRDDDGFVVDYIGHGLQGGIFSSSFEQHDPKGRGLVYVNNGNYWRSRLKAMAWSAVLEVQWKIGPASEASIGNSGRNTYFTPRVHGRSTNETGFQDFVDTPVVGFWWNVGEDALDRYVMPKVWHHTHSKWVLSAAAFMTPCKSGANLLRFKAMYYRDFELPPVR